MSITSTLVHRADIRFREAADLLRPFVGCFWVVTAERNATIRVVPDGSTAISIELPRSRSSEWMLRGPLVKPDERRFTSPGMLVGVRLRPGVAFLLSGIPARATLGRRIRLATVASFQELVTAEVSARTPDEYIDVLEQFLVARLRNASLNDVVARTICQIERSHGALRVSELAARCGISPRHLNRLLQLWLGYNTKAFANIIRFQATLHEIDQSPSQPGARLASETGYFDQSHLTQALGRFAGDTPRRLAANSVSDFSKTRCDDEL